MKFEEALDTLMKERGTTGAALAKALKITPPAVSGWLRTGKISTEKLFEVAKYFGVDAEALSTGKISKTKTTHFCTIPILNEVQAGLMTDINDDFSDMELLPVEAKYGRCFALRIKGKSMYPKYKEGDYVIVDPNKLPTSGNDVVAMVEGDNQATFKRYRERSTPEGKMYYELYPLNDDFPTINSLSRNIMIKGVKVALFSPD